VQYVVAQYSDLQSERALYRMPVIRKASAGECCPPTADVVVGWVEGLGPVQGDPTNPARPGREQR